MDLQILALVRFAYPGLGGFQTEHSTVAARQAHLWAPERMEARLRTLEHVCLRTLAEQTDGGFRTLIVTGDALPEPWRSRLHALVASVDGAEVVHHPPENPRDAMERIVAARVDPDGPPVVQFRQDDDDGVGLRFVERVRRTAGQCRALHAQHGRLCIDFPVGYAYAPGPLRVHRTFRHHLGVAHALMLAPSIRRTAVHFPHHRVGHLMPTVTLPDAPMWLRGIGGNDSDTSAQARALAPPTTEERADLERRFGLDLGALA
ncbi:hypothetical protein JQC91_12665 [Jannaschia sp. Os4]|uniref:glycosyltransferase n=1 Tax=Jannaschia sp. Os4 TaxID=2807617 RepID=UPI0019395613|nr:glycosyltransferase [Jannaschia sp. Os4]MBM2577153.1 hypothetical protein [Jannaschia sp. Os4]